MPRMRCQNEQANGQFRLGKRRGKSTAPANPRAASDRGPRAAASAAGIMMNRHDPRCRARRKERGSKRIREKNPHLRAHTYIQDLQGETISQSERFISPSAVPPHQPASTRFCQVQC